MPKVRRQIFVLTLEEKKIVACVVGALLLGLATRHYRATHPHPPPVLTAKQERAAKSEARAAVASSRSANRAATRVKPAPSPELADDE